MSQTITESRLPGLRPAITLRLPVAEDGLAVNRMISACPPLDTNSVYCNLLQCTHFSDTCVVAEYAGEIIGFTSAYLIPNHRDTLFIWQIAVSARARGQGLAKSMLREILLRPVCAGVTCVNASIAPDNAASRQLFQNLAASINATCTATKMFEHDRHFHGQHPDETLLCIRSENGSIASNLQSTREVSP